VGPTGIPSGDNGLVCIREFWLSWNKKKKTQIEKMRIKWIKGKLLSSPAT
jgi:hypothetical protein